MWVKLDDQMPNDPEVDGLSDGAFRLYVTAICYCQAELTDGYITTAKLRRIVPNYKPAYLRELSKLSDHPDGPLLAPVDEGYMIRNFTKYNQTRDHWRRKRAADAARMAEWREKKEAERRAS